MEIKLSKEELEIVLNRLDQILEEKVKTAISEIDMSIVAAKDEILEELDGESFTGDDNDDDEGSSCWDYSLLRIQKDTDNPEKALDVLMVIRDADDEIIASTIIKQPSSGPIVTLKGLLDLHTEDALEDLGYCPDTLDISSNSSELVREMWDHYDEITKGEQEPSADGEKEYEEQYTVYQVYKRDHKSNVFGQVVPELSHDVFMLVRGTYHSMLTDVEVLRLFELDPDNIVSIEDDVDTIDIRHDLIEAAVKTIQCGNGCCVLGTGNLFKCEEIYRAYVNEFVRSVKSSNEQENQEAEASSETENKEEEFPDKLIPTQYSLKKYEHGNGHACGYYILDNRLFNVVLSYNIPSNRTDDMEKYIKMLDEHSQLVRNYDDILKAKDELYLLTKAEDEAVSADISNEPAEYSVYTIHNDKIIAAYIRNAGKAIVSYLLVKIDELEQRQVVTLIEDIVSEDASEEKFVKSFPIKDADNVQMLFRQADAKMRSEYNRLLEKYNEDNSAHAETPAEDD